MSLRPLQYNSSQQRCHIRRQLGCKSGHCDSLQLKSAEIVSHKLLAKKQVLPEIQSPFLKKTIYHLFATEHLKDGMPGKRYSNQLKIDKDDQLASQDLEAFASRGLRAVFREQCVSETDVASKLYQRIGKSFSESKKQPMHFEDMTPQKLLALKKSDKRISKVATEGSASTATSKEIYQKLNRLNQKNKLVSLQQGSEEKESLKLYKQSHFVMKYKLAKSLHSQNQQLRTLKSQIKDINAVNLRENIKVKNYTKFWTPAFDTHN